MIARYRVVVHSYTDPVPIPIGISEVDPDRGLVRVVAVLRQLHDPCFDQIFGPGVTMAEAEAMVAALNALATTEPRD